MRWFDRWGGGTWNRAERTHQDRPSYSNHTLRPPFVQRRNQLRRHMERGRRVIITALQDGNSVGKEEGRPKIATAARQEEDMGGGGTKKQSASVRFALSLFPFYSREGGRTTRQPQPVDVQASLLTTTEQGMPNKNKKAENLPLLPPLAVAFTPPARSSQPATSPTPPSSRSSRPSPPSTPPPSSAP